MTILGQAELFKTTIRLDPTRSGPTVTLFDGLYLGKYKRWRREIQTLSLFVFKIETLSLSLFFYRLQFVLLKF